MFEFIKKMFVVPMSIFSCNALNAIQLNTVPLNAIPSKCVSINNQGCRIRPEIINIDSNEPTFYPYSIIKVNKQILCSKCLLKYKCQSIQSNVKN